MDELTSRYGAQSSPGNGSPERPPGKPRPAPVKEPPGRPGRDRPDPTPIDDPLPPKPKKL